MIENKWRERYYIVWHDYFLRCGLPNEARINIIKILYGKMNSNLRDLGLSLLSRIMEIKENKNVSGN